MVRIVSAATAVVVLVAGACGDDGRSGDAAEGTPRVVAGFYPLAEAARRVGGDGVTVTDLTPAGVEPHDLELSARQLDALEDADLVLYLGDGFQPEIDDVASRLDDRRALDLGAVLADDRDDAHFWLDPRLMIDAVEQITSALRRVRSSDAPTFEANARRYTAELRRLDRDFAEGLSSCRRSVVVSSHAAFGHLARRYRLTEKAVSGFSPESEPDPKRMAELIDVVKENGVTTVFAETLVPTDVAKTLGRETGAKVAVLDPIEGVTDEQREAGEDYLSLMRANLAALREALGCP